MVEMKIDANEIKGKSGMVQKYAEFIKEKTSADVFSEGNTITVKGEGPAVAKKYLRILTKKFLHKYELIDTYRVIADEGENALQIIERKIYNEEED
ncbi:MAG: 60S ribosomal protein L22 [Candidatus Bathyarchaeota archaeon]|nr:60S ribosomal protein L22 [Candidatus Termiticorpusculum sp.]MCL1969863.1 60S ribosomal protein L22 [Candidatus Termiticorpusculum sp.]